jgi:crotonobetainyl-CoA:carnitine CoA-transferase CaiB-like acyl-CoA transferase
MSDEEAPTGALDGVRVLEIGGGLCGPFAARLLGDLGADVVKVERPGAGDRARSMPPLFGNDPREREGLFEYLNWNKRSVALD